MDLTADKLCGVCIHQYFLIINKKNDKRNHMISCISWWKAWLYRCNRKIYLGI